MREIRRQHHRGCQHSQNTRGNWTSRRHGSLIDGWRVLNLDKREMITIPGPPVALEGSTELGDRPYLERPMGGVWDGVSAFLCSILEPEMIPFEHLPKLAKDKTELSAAGPDGVTMTDLPDGIFKRIFYLIDSFRDATNLCLTNSRTLLVGLHRIEQLYRRTLAPWSGDRVIIVRVTSKPPFSDPETALAGYECTIPNIIGSDVVYPGDNLFAYFEPDRPAVPLKGFTWFKPPADPASYFPLTWQRNPGFQWQRFGGVFFYHYPVEPWIICNLTKREYAMVDDPDEHTLKRGVLYTRRQENQASELRYKEDWKLTLQKLRWSMNIRGQWAGDRIAIVTLIQAQSSYTDWSQWKEVTGR